MKTARLDALARSLTGPFAFCGIAVSQPGQRHFSIGTADGIHADSDTFFRVASISKIVTAAVFEIAAGGAGLARPYAVPVSDILGFDVVHPRWPDTPVTFGQLMTHSSGLWDDGDYLFDGPLSDGFDPSTMFGPARPGTFFRYCNLGYILLAAAAERLAGERFDALVADALGSNWIVGGFNWVGVADADMADALPTYRRDGARFAPKIDAPAQRPDMQGYRLGQDTWKFSPQGGFRTSLATLSDLAAVMIGGGDGPLWRAADGPGDYLDGLMQDYGAGLQFLPNPSFYPRPLMGHFANAYGFKGGVWCDGQADISFAYALNGLAVRDESDALCDAETRIFNAVANVKD